VTGLDALRGHATIPVWRRPGDPAPSLASVLGLSKGAVWAGVHAGQLPARRVGRRWLVPVPALLAWLGATEPRAGPNGDGPQGGGPSDVSAEATGERSRAV
jgi:excisionase family DNA binding protein